MKLKIIVAGSGNVSAATRSNGWDVVDRVEQLGDHRRGCAAPSAATRRGVNARTVGFRSRRCAGSSRLTIDGCGLWPPSSRIFCASGTRGTSGSCAFAAEYVALSRKTCSISA